MSKTNGEQDSKCRTKIYKSNIVYFLCSLSNPFVVFTEATMKIFLRIKILSKTFWIIFLFRCFYQTRSGTALFTACEVTSFVRL